MVISQLYAIRFASLRPFISFAVLQLDPDESRQHWQQAILFSKDRHHCWQRGRRGCADTPGRGNYSVLPQASEQKERVLPNI